MTAETNIPAVELERRDDAPPVLHAQPINAAPLLGELAQHQADWARKFNDGDITASEFTDGLNRLADRREEIRWSARKAELAEELVQGQRMNNWSKAVKEFMATDGKQIAANVDARGAPGALLRGLDAAVKAEHSDPANRGLSDRAIIAKANRKFREGLDQALGAPDQATGRSHASLNNLDPIALEDAVAQMTPEERDAYLR